MNNKNFDWKKTIINCLEENKYCCLATVDSNGVWANPVYFAYDDKFNFYFISQIDSRHMQNIQDDPRVSIAIYNTHQEKDVEGVYVEGKAKILDELEERLVAHKIYYGRSGSNEQNEEFVDDLTWLLVKVKPDEVHYFNSKLFGEVRQTVPKEVYN